MIIYLFKTLKWIYLYVLKWMINISQYSSCIVVAGDVEVVPNEHVEVQVRGQDDVVGQGKEHYNIL